MTCRQNPATYVQNVETSGQNVDTSKQNSQAKAKNRATKAQNRYATGKNTITDIQTHFCSLSDPKRSSLEHKRTKQSFA